MSAKHVQTHREAARDRAATTSLATGAKPAQSVDSASRVRSQSASRSAHRSVSSSPVLGPTKPGAASPIEVEKLIHRDGRVKLEYTEKFINEVNQLIERYIKPTREILSRPKINFADKKLQKFLQVLQIIQQRLVKVISEVKNDEGTVSLAIKANDSIVSTILWFNSLVKKSKTSRDKKGAMLVGKGESVSKQVMENVDLVGLEQQLLLDNANLFKKKQLRDLKEMKERQRKEEEKLKQQQQQQASPQSVQAVNDNANNNNNNGTVDENAPVAVNGNVNMTEHVQTQQVQGSKSEERVQTESEKMAQQIQQAVDGMQQQNEPMQALSAQVVDSTDISLKVEDEKEKAGDIDPMQDLISSLQQQQPASTVSDEPEKQPQPPPPQQQQQQLDVSAANQNATGDNNGNAFQSKSFSSFSSIDINSQSQANLNNNDNNNNNDNVVVNVESSSDVNNVSNAEQIVQAGDNELEKGSDNDDEAAADDMVDLLNVETDETGQTQSNATDEVPNQ